MVVDVAPLQFFLAALAGWLSRQQQDVIGYLVEENRVLRAQLRGRRLRLTDDQRRRLACDRDPKWSAPLRHVLEESKVCVVQTPFQAPNCNAHAERLVRSIKEECLNRMIPMGERHFRRAMHEFVELDYRERNHQGLNHELIDGHSSPGGAGRIGRRQRLGGLLNYYYRAA